MKFSTMKIFHANYFITLTFPNLNSIVDVSSNIDLHDVFLILTIAGCDNLTVTAKIPVNTCETLGRTTTYDSTLVRNSACDSNGCCDGSTPTYEGIYVINPFSSNNDTMKTY